MVDQDAVLSASPTVILVRPQMGENIGMAARAMANFGLAELRLVSPRDGWGEGSSVMNSAVDAAVGAHPIVRSAKLFATLPEAVADLHRVFATTARDRDQAKPVVSPAEWAAEAVVRQGAAQRLGVVFGPERTGLSNDEVGLADALLTFPVNPVHPSLNLAQAVSLVAYEWWKTAQAGDVPFRLAHVTPPATRAMVQSFLDHLDAALEAAGYFHGNAKDPIMRRNLHNILHRVEMTEADVRTLRGVVGALSEGRRRGAARRSGEGN